MTLPNNSTSIHNSDNKFFFVLAGALVFFVVFSATLSSRVERGNISKPTRSAKSDFPELNLEAKSVFVYDLRESKVLLEKNANKALPLASLTKIMSALVAVELSPLYSTIRITNEALSNYGDSGLRDGERWSLKDLLDFSLLTSSNDGISAVALSLAGAEPFVDKMNLKAEKLGLTNTHFQNETGLDVTSEGGAFVQGGAYGTAKGVAELLSYIIEHKPGLLEATRELRTSFTSLDNQSYQAINTDYLVDRMPGALASKTGFTDLAGGNLAFAFDPELGRPIVVVILGSSAEGRFSDAEKLIEATMDYITQE